ncbi:MAG: NAD-dependent epimerase/dehydratase family protein [Roseivirga sp.]|nr:NAD-dependent epimerase/dehydratase family protein [Roseivirga sp.]
MNWLITGGCGFIGRNLIKMLINRNPEDSIRVIDNFSVGTPDDLDYATDNYREETIKQADWSAKEIQVIQGDILDENLAIEVSSGADVIVHLAANTGVGPSVENPRMDCVTNVIGTFNYLEAARRNKIKRFVFASSGAPIGECNPPIHEELACHPVSPYGASKMAGEGYCSSYARTFGVGTVALRFGNVYGPGSTHKSSVVAKFIRQALNGETLEIYGDGSQTRDFIFTEDLILAILAGATTEGVGGEVFQIATNRETTVLEVTDLLVKCLREKGVDSFDVIHGEKRLGDVMRNFSDTSKAKELLKWEPGVELKEGLLSTVEWFMKK